MSRVVTFKWSEGLVEAVDEAAEKASMSRSEYVRSIVMQRLNGYQGSVKIVDVREKALLEKADISPDEIQAPHKTISSPKVSKRIKASKKLVGCKRHGLLICRICD